MTADGEVTEFPAAAAAAHRPATPPLVCHRPAVARRLGLASFPALDLLELFAFVHPARFTVPTPRGLAQALDLPEPSSLADAAMTLLEAAQILLARLAKTPPGQRGALAGIAALMESGGWEWAGAVRAALGETPGKAPEKGGAADRLEPLRVWKSLPEFSEHAPEPPPGNIPVTAEEVPARLALLLGPDTPIRPCQGDYAAAVALAFQPRDEPGSPALVLAEAGTGIGKTLGYIAPASLWAAKNGGAVWLSTYTRNLQRQLDGELDRLYGDPVEKARKVVVRKGRENYLCLLNFEEAIQRLAARREDAVALGLVARWVSASRDGDIAGGDFPGWLADLLGRPLTVGLADRRGECIYAACSHFHKCFIERTVRRARRAEIVVANHALVMAHAALGGLDDDSVPLRTVFDEGHHLFDAADSAFSVQLSGAETAELRRWLIGAEEGGRTRARGLKRRIEDLAAHSDEAAAALEAVLHHARVLPAPGWHNRLRDDQPHGPAEEFLNHVRRQVLARAAGPRGLYDLETDIHPPIPGLDAAASRLEKALEALERPVGALIKALVTLLDDEAADLDSSSRSRIDSACRSLQRRAALPLAAWRGMLRAVTGETPPAFVDWFAIERPEGREGDIGMHRHWIDPTFPFAESLSVRTQGIVMTSATLTDASFEAAPDWRAAEARTGAVHLPAPPSHCRLPSPFDYAARTRVLVVTDVRKEDQDQVAAAYRELFIAAGGGALGLFTAVARLKAVHQRILGPLDEAGLPLLAQHVDPLDPATLVDIFRAEPESCLLGTDAMRDGVDVPGRALRLLVFDRVPWPRPDILHRARKAASALPDYDDVLTRLKLKQAFGRLVRRADDVGVFVMLDSRLPTRLTTAFPVPVQRVGLAEAVRLTREFLASD